MSIEKFSRNQHLIFTGDDNKKISVIYVKMLDVRSRPNYVVVKLPDGRKVTVMRFQLSAVKDE